jgi:hypothetical protein
MPAVAGMTWVFVFLRGRDTPNPEAFLKPSFLRKQESPTPISEAKY